MSEAFSPAVRLWIEKQALLVAAQKRFWEEWGQMLRGVKRRLAAKGWQSRTYNEPPDIIQLYRPGWPGGVAQVHYEVLCHEEFRQQGIVDFSLHFEDRLPNQEQVCARMRQLIRPHARGILAACACSMPDEPLHDILKGSLELVGVTGDKIVAMVEAMAQTESFVDEAVALAGCATVWRTGFTEDDAPDWLNWFGSAGGQEIIRGAGRFGSTALRIDGTRPNARTHDIPKSCYSVPLHPTHGIQNACECCVAVVLKTETGGTLRIWTEGHEGKTAEGHPKKLPKAFSFSAPVDGADHWQCVSFRASVPSFEAAKYDFARDGTWMAVNVLTPDKTFLIDSIEVALCPSGRQVS